MTDKEVQHELEARAQHDRALLDLGVSVFWTAIGDQPNVTRDTSMNSKIFDMLVKAEWGKWYSPCGVVTMADRGFEGNFSPERLAEARNLYAEEQKFLPNA